MSHYVMMFLLVTRCRRRIFDTLVDFWIEEGPTNNEVSRYCARAQMWETVRVFCRDLSSGLCYRAVWFHTDNRKYDSDVCFQYAQACDRITIPLAVR